MPETQAQPRVLSQAITAHHPRPQVRGKFLFIGNEKLYIKGVTYGTFEPCRETADFPKRSTVRADFEAMASHGINAVRIYIPPPRWLLDDAAESGLYVMVGLPWEQHITFLDEPGRADDIRKRVRDYVRQTTGHPALLCYSLGNEIPASIVRWHGPKPVQRFLDSLYQIVKEEDPHTLTTYVNFPTTEYLELDFVDFLSFNVYLETEDSLSKYLARLQNLAGDKPLVMAEVGLDSRRNGELKQAEVLDWQIRTIFTGGCAGTFVFAWTDEWHRGGHPIEDWDFGLVTRDRCPKRALAVVEKAFAETPFPSDTSWPSVSVVICSYNGSRTIRETLAHITKLPYPNYEVIVVDDGSTDSLPDIAAHFDVNLIRIPNGGLSNARNVGMRAARGEIIAYCDDDAYPDPHWLHYLAHTYLTTDYAGVGGPNLPPAGDGPIAEAIANAPGGPNHVLLTDTEAEHIPGCNSSYRRECLMEIGGYDPTFRVAGDDVDVCWRIQEKGWKVGFHPAAFVWHHRRNSVKAYWRQQKGYGKAEALLERKWPEKYNALGHLTWHGRLYGNGALLPFGGRSRIYHGTWGSALFQSLYAPVAGRIQSLAQMPEWYVLVCALWSLSVLGLFWAPLQVAVPLAVLSFAIPIAQAMGSARRARSLSSRSNAAQGRLRLVLFTAALFVAQPVARLSGRIGFGLTPFRPRSAFVHRYCMLRSETVWSEIWRSPEQWIEHVESAIVSLAGVRRGCDFDEWDLEVIGGIAASARLTFAFEEHGAGKQLLRCRVRARMSPLFLSVVLGFASLCVAAAFSKAATVSVVLAVVAVLTAAWLVRDLGASVGAAVAGLNEMRSAKQ